MIVALFGVRGSGKDTVGKILVNHHSFYADSFAAPLKAMVGIAFDFTDQQLYGPSHCREEQDERYPFSGDCMSCGRRCDRTGDPATKDWWKCRLCDRLYPPFVNARLALQSIGTEWGRRLSRNLWIDAGLLRARRAAVADGKSTVFTDGRFKNEHDRLIEAGAKTVLLLRGLDDSVDTHPSEAELKTIPRESFTYVLDNRGSLDDLPWAVHGMMNQFV